MSVINQIRLFVAAHQELSRTRAVTPVSQADNHHDPRHDNHKEKHRENQLEHHLDLIC